MSKTRIAVSTITVTAPNQWDHAYSMMDPDYGPREFSDGTSVGGLNYSTVHNSALGPNVQVVHLEAHASQDPSQEPPEKRPVGTVSSISRIEYTFRLMKDANLRLMASTAQDSTNGGTAATSIRLDGPGSTIINYSGAGDTGEIFLSLLAGTYTLRASTTAQVGGGPLPTQTKTADAEARFELRQWPDHSPVEILDAYRSQWLTFDEGSRRARIHDFPRTRFWSGGIEPSGVVADGVTPLLVRWRPETWAQEATLRLPGFPSGRLVTVDQWNQGPPFLEEPVFEPVVFEQVNLPGYQHANRYIYGVYVPPSEFASGGYADYGWNMPRLTSIRGQGWYNGLPGQEETADLRIYRPPVVLLHGLEDEGASWSWALGSDPRFLVHIADYEATNNVRFAENVLQHRVVLKAVHDAKQMAWDRNVAVTQVDLFGHSMGGLLARLWSIQDNLYVRAENLYRGDFHKLITVNTPHRGSPISCLVVNADGSTTPYGGAYGPWADLFGRRCTPCGAAADLRPDSIAITTINANGPSVPVPVHAMVGIGALRTPDHRYTRRTANWIIGPCPSVTMESFFGGDSDAIVTAESQRGGLDQSATIDIDGAEGLHYPVINEVADGLPNEWAMFLLNTSAFDDQGMIAPPFADGFPIFAEPAQCSPQALLCSNDVPGRPALLFATPLPNAIILGGSQLRTRVVASDPPTAVHFRSTLGSDEVLTIAPYEFTLDIPQNFTGPLRLSAFATYPQGTFAVAATVTVQVIPPVRPDAIRTQPSSARLLHQSPTQALRVLGDFPDGFDRDLTQTTGLSFAMDDPSIAEVAPDGVVRGLRVGQTVLRVSFDGRTSTTLIDVQSAPGDLNSDGAVDGSDAAEFTAAFTGAVSTPGYRPPIALHQFVFDFDGDNDIDCDDWQSLRHRWTSSTPPSTLAECTECPADFNGDGGLNSQDFFDFLSCFFTTQCPNADFNHSGSANSQDFFDFLAAFFEGC